MSIKMLELIYQNYVNIPNSREHNTIAFMDITITLFKKLQKQINNKEDKIDVNNIKEVKRING